MNIHEQTMENPLGGEKKQQTKRGAKQVAPLLFAHLRSQDSTHTLHSKLSDCTVGCLRGLVVETIGEAACGTVEGGPPHLICWFVWFVRLDRLDWFVRFVSLGRFGWFVWFGLVVWFVMFLDSWVGSVVWFVRFTGLVSIYHYVTTIPTKSFCVIFCHGECES